MLYVLADMVIPPKTELKNTAKSIKKFLVLIKRKLQRGQVCRNRLFRKLMAMVYDLDLEDMSHKIAFGKSVFHISIATYVLGELGLDYWNGT